MKLLLTSLLLRCIVAFPTAKSDGTLEPILPRLSYSIAAGSCSNTTIGTIVRSTSASLMRLEHTLQDFAPWKSASEPSLGLKTSCTLAVNIGVPVGYKAHANPFGSTVKGYVNVPNEGTVAVFTQEYFFLSKPNVIATSSIKFAGPKEGTFTEKTLPEGTALSSCEGDLLISKYNIQVLRTDSGKAETTEIALAAAADTDWVIHVGVDIVPC